MGGGWCWTADDCAGRAKTFIGSSTSWPPLLSSLPYASPGGSMADDPSTNPVLANFTFVWVMYCDGTSYTGSRDEPLQHGAQTLFFRGRAVLDAIVADIRNRVKPSLVVLAGSSAGGLTVYLHADAIADAFGSAVRVVALPDAGFFLDAQSYDGGFVYGRQARGALPLWNATKEGRSFPHRCADRNPGAVWRCFFASHLYPVLRTPVFVTNSLYDSWQLGNILYLPCTFSTTGPGNCSNAELAAIEQYGQQQRAALDTVLNDTRANGVWIDTCIVHTQTCAPSWSGIRAQPSQLSMAEAFGAWLNGQAVPRVVDEAGLPWQGGANPTCTVSVGGWC
jgi:hypothetical protein